VVAVTARDGEADAVLALEAGADDYVTKPVGIAELPLTYSEFEVLDALLRAGGRLLSRQELLDAIFGGHEFRDPRAIDVHVHFLRDKLTAAGADPDLIVTVRGAGYRLRA
jgi:DNA-binding response OmpR family regulator